MRSRPLGLAAVTVKAIVGKAISMRKDLEMSNAVRKGISYRGAVVLNPRKAVVKGMASISTVLRNVLGKSVRARRRLILGSKYSVGKSVCAYGLRVRPGTLFGNTYGAVRRGVRPRKRSPRWSRVGLALWSWSPKDILGTYRF